MFGVGDWYYLIEWEDIALTLWGKPVNLGWIFVSRYQHTYSSLFELGLVYAKQTSSSLLFETIFIYICLGHE